MEVQTHIDLKINEAEACRSMQLLNDSLRIYEEVLADVPSQETAVHAKIENRIRLLRQEITDIENRGPDGDIDGEIDSIIGQLPEQEDAEMIFDKASAFKEMGLHRKAVAEYAKLFREGFQIDLFVPDLAECLLKLRLLKLHAPQKAVGEIDQLIKNQSLKNFDRARIKFLFGRVLEKRDHREPALGLYKAAGELDPDDAEIKK
jgi:tetratricopeptide (TPR) repeat protein